MQQQHLNIVLFPFEKISKSSRYAANKDWSIYKLLEIRKKRGPVIDEEIKQTLKDYSCKLKKIGKKQRIGSQTDLLEKITLRKTLIGS